MIRVEQDAQKTNAYQENRNLLLSQTAHADSIPGLEILANDVRCTHGATLGQVDREQLFYLMARGLSRAEAERLIVRGFFQDVLDRDRARAGARGARRRARGAHPAGVACMRHDLPMEAIDRPRLRGVFHFYAFFAALVAGTALVVLADGMRERFAAWVYAAALAAMFGASALYHRFPGVAQPGACAARRVDHAMIFVFIAGTYTPFALLAFSGRLSAAVLVAVWAGAVLGLVLNLVWIDAPRWISAVAYLAVGWVGVIMIPQLFAAGIAPAVLVAVGGSAVHARRARLRDHVAEPVPGLVRVPRGVPPPRDRGCADAVRRSLARRPLTSDTRQDV